MPHKKTTKLKNRELITTNNGVALGRVSIRGSYEFFVF